MRLKHELKECTEKMQKLDSKELLTFFAYVRDNERYKNLEIRILWLLYWMIYNPEERKRFEGCKDTHITTLIRRALFNAHKIEINSTNFTTTKK